MSGPDQALIDQIKGFIDPEEGQRLYNMAKKAAKIGPGLEIGSYCGKSALYLGPAFKERDSILFSIDHHRGSEEQQPGEEYFDPDLLDPRTGQIDTLSFFRKALEKADLEETVVPIVSRSQTAARQWSTPLSLVFIDGGHAFETALQDYQSWAPHIMPGGYLLIHDLFEDPTQGGQAPYDVYKIALASNQFTQHPRTKTLGVLQNK